MISPVVALLRGFKGTIFESALYTQIPSQTVLLLSVMMAIFFSHYVQMLQNRYNILFFITDLAVPRSATPLWGTTVPARTWITACQIPNALRALYLILPATL